MERFSDSISNAFTGIGHAFEGRNFKIQAIIGVVALYAAYYMQISTSRLIAVILTTVLVLSMETMNTAIEELANKLHPESHPHIAMVKDLAAGAVLIASIAALVVGFLVFAPYFY